MRINVDFIYLFRYMFGGKHIIKVILNDLLST